MTTSRTIFALFTAMATVIPLAGQSPAPHTVTIFSPDGKTCAEVDTADGVLRYRIVVNGKQVLAPSMIGIEADDVELGREVTLGPAKLRKVDEHYRFFGAHAGAAHQQSSRRVD